MTYLVADTHGADINIPQDGRALIHLGDWIKGKIAHPGGSILPALILIRGNHDNNVNLEKFDIITDGILIDGIWLSHEPVERLPKGAHLNVHGHLHDNNYEDYGYIKKPFHVCLVPGKFYELSGFTGGSHA